MKNKSILITSWAVNILILLVSIILPKNNKIYNITFYVFLICIFVMPLLLSAYEIKIAKTNCYFNEIKINTYGSMTLMLLSMVRFIQTIDKIAWPMFFTIVILFVVLTTFIDKRKKEREETSNLFRIFRIISLILISFTYICWQMIDSILILLGGYTDKNGKPLY